MATSLPVTASPGELVARSIAALNDHDTAALRAFLTAATQERFPDRTLDGADAIAAYFDELFAAVPDFRLEIVKLVEQGEDVFVRWRMTGTHTGGPYAG